MNFQKGELIFRRFGIFTLFCFFAQDEFDPIGNILITLRIFFGREEINNYLIYVHAFILPIPLHLHAKNALISHQWIK